MKLTLLLVGAAVVLALGIGSAIAWGSSSQPAPAVWGHGIGAGPAQPGADMGAMHRRIHQAEIDRMVELCEKAMESARMMDGDNMMGDAGMMGRADGMMGGGMMGP